MARWWEDYPERLARERQALTDAHIPFTVIDEDLARGVYSLRLTVEIGGESQELIATYPDLYPFFRFQVRAPTLTLARHQHPFGKVLCLIGRDTLEWDSADTLADYLIEQLPKLLSAVGDSPAVAATLEEHQGEPFTAYFPYAPAMCLVDSSWVIPPEVDCGQLLLGVIDLRPVTRDGPVLLTAAVLEVRDSRGNAIGQADPALVEAFGQPQFVARWCRLKDPSVEAHDDSATHAEQLWKLGQDLDPSSFSQQPYRLGGEFEVSVRGFLIQEEVAYRRDGDAWFFVVRVRPSDPNRIPRPRGTPIPRSKGKKAARTDRPSRFYFARGGRSGREDLIARAPALRLLRDRRIAQVGLGCLGGTSVIEFARAGVGRIRVLEDDVVEPGTVLRWPLGLDTAGKWKGVALGQFMARNYPYTEFEPSFRQLGAVRASADLNSDEDILGWLFEDASLVFDASASHGAQQALSAYARTGRLPYVRVAASLGAWGGYVLRIRPDQTPGCAWCFYLHQEDGKYLPPVDESGGNVQPLGCADPTYIGAGFELGQIALQGVRMAISTLGAGAAEAFPDVEWDIAVIALRGPNGEVIPSHVTTSVLERHPACEICARSPASGATAATGVKVS